MISRMNVWLTTLGILGVLCAVNNAIPLPADEDDTSAALQPVKLPFSLELEPPLPDSTGAAKPVVLPLRDSYGNPILPAVLGVDPSGVDYDLGARPNSDGPKKTVFTQGINFPIPSYASGITEIHRPSDGLLPPFDSDKRPNTGNGGPATNPASSSILSPVTDLLPPLSIPLSKDESINEISGQALQERFGTNFNVQQLPSFINSLQQPNQRQPKPSFFIPVPASEIPNQPLAAPAPGTAGPVGGVPKPSASAEPGKYTGGFGGAPGVLGEQKEVGFLIKPEQGGAAAAAASPAVPAPVLPPVQEAPPPKPVVVPAPAAPAAPATPAHSPSGSKYTGGFGGPPGFLVPYDNEKKDA